VSEGYEISIAIISDLHCHHSRKFDKEDSIRKESYLLTDLPRNPPDAHPVQSLIEFINKDQNDLFKCNYLICPGDITHQVDIQGFLSGWEFIKEIGELLKVEDVIATLGNHDVDSRYSLSEDVFNIARSLEVRGFPFSNKELIRDFWSDGFCIYEGEFARVLVVNSVHFHTNEDQAVKGKFDKKQRESLRNKLELLNDEKIQIALFHHPPIPQTENESKEGDYINEGDQLLNLLEDFKFDIALHGHKHEPRLRFTSGGENIFPIFSSGSFSIVNPNVVGGTYNTFHIIKLNKKLGKRACGQIITCEYLPNHGWRLANSGDELFPTSTGFGFRGDISELVKKADQILTQGSRKTMKWDEMLNEINELNYLTKKESLSFREELRKINIITSPELPRIPDLVGRFENPNNS